MYAACPLVEVRGDGLCKVVTIRHVPERDSSVRVTSVDLIVVLNSVDRTVDSLDLVTYSNR
ncbi:hypothetical protein SVXHx_5093 (plasmid) [Haloferax volcanii]|nr:hypothetical protein SVXHx_5093 [Haloferax lucentense]